MNRANIKRFSTIRFNNIDSKELGIYVAEKFPIPFAKKDVKDIEVIGRNGSLTLDYNTYKDIEISIDFYIYKEEIISNNMRELRRWLTNIKDNRLYLPQSILKNIDVYFRVKRTEINELSYVNSINKKLFKVNVKFICEPFQYKSNGIKLDNLSNINKYTYYTETILTSYPVYKIKGEGLITLNVNKKKFEVNVGQSCVIDTRRMMCYKDNGTLINSSVKGDYQNLLFKEGKNEITWSGNISKLEILEDMIIS